MTAVDYFRSLRRRWVVIVVLTVLGGLAGFAYASTQTETFRAQAAVVVIPTRGDSTMELVQGSNYVQGLVQTYAVVATSPAVLGPVIEELELDTTPRALAGRITVDSPLDTTVLEIAATGADPEMTANIANAVADQLADAVEDLAPQTQTSGPAVRVETISEAVAPRAPIAPNTRLIAIAGALAGFVLGVVYAVLRQLLATRLTSREDVAAVTDMPILGEVSAAGGTSLPAAVRDSAVSAAAESVRGIAAGLRFANIDGDAKVILITSAVSGEGKSSIALATALILAEQGQRTLLIDADLRRGSIATLTGLEGGVGVTTVLLGDATEDEALHQWGSPSLRIMTSGTIPPNPGQLLASDHLRDLISAARERFDVVIVDSPPVLAVSDPMWLAPIVDGIVVIARYRYTKRDELVRALGELESTRARVFGLVLNGTKRAAGNPYYVADAPAKRGSRSRTPRAVLTE
ncbi:polysaccharide biosynthesis tyrosine autokinase [Microbacterium sp. zg.Y1090]|uniref:polysaccharide biosynthesis tyrosine autokinase n=1 Tax=Microbacterium TaxID=33882 RepID=UPI00214B996C|nr:MULTISPECIES: polysaccharide biosynthesis tyrosine autokinase [unclassified Microbacterium]MCR2814120.1 polysaccharide biosynthesis tyrosine autokinase [Microbacterium sp. zg.Y1084]MCR2817875.1 polysaccharide biosynthesis tyrosine autokinase [Microbacterium sp. zg.Y1090]MDL5487729.1 polysaccharide biosynthesis tyrosine autokinase [Microbacterium sp. zg-Y1211]WIM27955.1 polysaccharide biosynthesis tyrosine autokinase [Microbacterium sp. zg-Y1090]